MDAIGDTAVVIGAGYGAVQAIANLLMLVLPKNTVVFKLCKWLVSGVSRGVPEA